MVDALREIELGLTCRRQTDSTSTHSFQHHIEPAPFLVSVGIL